jgi:hypothetical protein
LPTTQRQAAVQLRQAEIPQSLAPEAAPPQLAQRPAPLQTNPTVTATARPAGPPPDLRAAVPPGFAAPPTPGETAPALASRAPPGAGSAPGRAPAAGPGTGAQGQGLASAGSGAPGAQGGLRGSVHPGCAPEDLILLTPAEKVRCRNEIDALNARRANRNAEDDAKRKFQFAKDAPYVDGLAPEKRAYFDAVSAANADVREGTGGAPGLACNFASLFGGTPGLPAEKIKIPGVPCVFVPPTGVLTEETRISPP